MLRHLVWGEPDQVPNARWPLGAWLHWKAHRAPGTRVRFAGLEAAAIVDAAGLRIMVRPGLATQLGGVMFAQIGRMEPTEFSEACHAAGIRYDDKDNSYAGKRWTVLAPAFVATLDLHTDQVGVAPIDAAAAGLKSAVDAVTEAVRTRRRH